MTNKKLTRKRSNAYPKTRGDLFMDLYMDSAIGVKSSNPHNDLSQWCRKVLRWTWNNAPQKVLNEWGKERAEEILFWETERVRHSVDRDTWHEMASKRLEGEKHDQ